MSSLRELLELFGKSLEMISLTNTYSFPVLVAEARLPSGLRRFELKMRS